MIKRLTKKIISMFRNGFLTSVIMMASGSLAAQVVTFACSFLLTRIYGETELGYFQYVTSFVAIFSAIIAGRYDVSIVSAKEERDVPALAMLSFVICGSFSALATVGVYVFSMLTSDSFDIVKGYLWFVFPLLIIDGVILVLNSYNNRNKDYGLMTGVYVIRSVAQNGLSLLLGAFSKLGAFALLISQFVGQLLGLKRQSKGFREKKGFLSRCKPSDLARVAKKYSAQPLLSAPSTLVTSLSYSAISISIESMFNASILGFYGISVRVLGLPLGIFSANISKVHYQRATKEIAETGRFKSCTRETLLIGILLAIPMGILLFIFSPMIFEFAFGKGWHVAGEYVRCLAPMYCFRLVAGTLGFSFILAGKQFIELIMQIGLLSAFAIVTAIATAFGMGIEQYLILISIGYSLVYVVEIFLMYYCSTKKISAADEAEEKKV